MKLTLGPEHRLRRKMELASRRRHITGSVRNNLAGMATIKSKVTMKSRTTIPRPVRAALRVKAGDELSYTIENDRVILTKATATAIDDPLATFSEWDSEADRKAFAHLGNRNRRSGSFSLYRPRDPAWLDDAPLIRRTLGLA